MSSIKRDSGTNISGLPRATGITICFNSTYLDNTNKPKVNILIPMAGRGSRFANQGFVQPKPLIDVGGRPMISWVLDNVDSEEIEATFIMIILKEHQGLSLSK
jgi:hypothetical protein